MIYDAKSILLNKRSEYKKLKEEKAGVKVILYIVAYIKY